MLISELEVFSVVQVRGAVLSTLPVRDLSGFVG